MKQKHNKKAAATPAKIKKAEAPKPQKVVSNAAAVSNLHRLFITAKLKLSRKIYRISTPLGGRGILRRFRETRRQVSEFCSSAGSAIVLGASTLGFLAVSAAGAVTQPVYDFSRRHNMSARLSRFATRLKQGRVNRVQVACVASVLTLAMLAAANYEIAIRVTVDGEELGFVRSEEEVQQIISDIEEHTSSVLGRPYRLEDEIVFETGITQRGEFVANDTIKERLRSDIDEVATLAVVTVDNKVIGGTTSATDAQGVLDEIMMQYTNGEKEVTASFLQSVSVDVREAPAELAVTKSELKDRLTADEIQEQMYTVKPGETFSGIAQAHGMKTSEIMALNPDIQPEKLQMGSEICVKGSKSLLSVQVIKEINYTEKIPYSTITKKNDDLPKNQTKTIQEGKEGAATVEAKVVMVDGVEQSRTIMSRTVMSESTDKIVEIGTKNTSVGTGNMRRPVGGRLTSNYGYRHGEFHTGVDLACPTGTPVRAADNGKVTFSGWHGSYGYCVIISHGNGLQTLYAHNSGLVAKAGQTVEKGDTIAKVGETGRATGPHCHFEVRVNGNHANPWKYIK